MDGCCGKCPKCGQFSSYNPKYVMDPSRGEHLEHRCRCGYVTITPTLDADQDEARRQWERRLGQWVLSGPGQQDIFPEPPPFLDEAWTKCAEELKQWGWEEKPWNHNGRVSFPPKPPVKPSEKKGEHMSERRIVSHRIHTGDRQPHIFVLGEAGPGGANQEYEIISKGKDGLDEITQLVFSSKEREGVTNEALLAVVIDRLQGFQFGPFACRENAEALEHCRSALVALHSRTLARVERGVERTLTK